MLTMTAAAQQQQTTVHTHNTSNADVIDGSKTPDLIPDSSAWRLWMLSVTAKDPKHPELDVDRENAFLRVAGFNEEDLPAVRQQLYDFRVAYDALLADHNQAEAAGRSPSLDALKIRRDTLVKVTKASLLSVRTESAEKVASFINHEKKHMRVSKTEVQLP
jgi:hypothetical protein